MADANRANLAFVEEVTFGVTPAGPPTLQDLRFTSESFRQDTNQVTSQEIRSDRQIADVIRTVINAAGDLGFELSAGTTYEEFIAAAMFASAYTAAVTDISADTTISVDSTSRWFESTVDEAFANYTVGAIIRVDGFTEAGNNGYFVVSAILDESPGVLDNNRLKVHNGGTLVTEVAGDSVTITQGKYVRNGTTLRSFSIERQYLDLTNQFAVYTGMAIQNFQLGIASDQVITGSFGFLGKQGVSGVATVGDGSNTAATTTQVMNSIDHVKRIFEGAVDIDAVELAVSWTNNLRALLEIGKLGAQALGSGSMEISGTLRQYFETAVLFNKYLNATKSDLFFAAEDGAANGLALFLPAVKYSAAQRVSGGINTDIIADMSYRAYLDPTFGFMAHLAYF